MTSNVAIRPTKRTLDCGKEEVYSGAQFLATLRKSPPRAKSKGGLCVTPAVEDEVAKRSLKSELETRNLKPETLFPSYPLTLIFENDNTALLGVGLPIDSAGRKVVKISIRFTCGNTSFDLSVSDKIR